ncbi:hypothetical protein Taro_009496 [Colocasia esculenta]|uniref:Uncharacterized protein n=1 Tax=Colocasia esculenta TaxID=4460 RepID=A0A843U6P3_COLES|nr:hypothetical protein [Colocasia esculenta]
MRQMNALVKALHHTPFSPTNPSPRSVVAAPPGRKKPAICSCSSSNGGSSSPSSSSPSEGDRRKQELLARIAMLQTQKVRLTEFLDERSDYLTQFAEDANAEFDQIGEDALRELDEASARILGNLESRMQAFEESAEVNRQEIEKNEKIVEEFEEKIERDRNEGLFFKNLTEAKKKPQEAAVRAEARAEARKLKQLEKEKAGSGTRRNVYLALMAVLGATVASAVVSSPEVEWRKVAALGFIFLALLAQYVYELQLSKGGGQETNKRKE